MVPAGESFRLDAWHSFAQRYAQDITLPHGKSSGIRNEPMSEPARKAKSPDEQAHDESLFDRLRQLRKTLADERDVPAYVVFSDVALRQMAQYYPTNEQDFLRISGVGSRKLDEFGAAFLGTIAEYLGSNTRQDFASTSTNPTPSAPTSGKPKPLNETTRETLRLLQRGFSVDHIAKQRKLAGSTIYGHLEQAIQTGEPVDINRILTLDQQTQIAAAFAKTGLANLTGAKELLGDQCDYNQLRLFRAVHEKLSHP